MQILGRLLCWVGEADDKDDIIFAAEQHVLHPEFRKYLGQKDNYYDNISIMVNVDNKTIILKDKSNMLLSNKDRPFGSPCD